jgi:ferredoxin
MPELPPCDCRVNTDQKGIYLCRHPMVHARANLVDRAVCATCQYCATPCPSPRSLEAGEVVDVRKMPPMQTRAWNLTKSLAAFVANGLRTVTDEQYAQRLNICDGCSERRDNYCLQCGCYLTWKATGRAFQCPLKKWPTIGAHEANDASTSVRQAQ